MKLADAPEAYDRSDEQRTRTTLEQADKGVFRQGKDVYLVQGERLILKSPNGNMWKLTVSDAGVVGATLV